MEIYIDEFTQESPDELDHGFQFIERIGSGAFGTVMHAIETATNRECAIKIINKSGKKLSSIQKMKQEITILKQLKHKNIVQFFGYTETNSKIYIIMEFIKYGTLKSWLINHKESIKEEEASLIISQILSAVQYLHSHEICHRDIKPENIMLSEKDGLTSLKLIDFGLSASNFTEYQESEYCGTFLYMAPEQIDRKTYSKAIDIWSIGIIMFMLLNNGRHPFYTKGNRRRTYIEKLKITQVKFYNKCSQMAMTLINKLLEVNPLWRYTAEKALRHPWITRNIEDDVPETFNETLKKRVVNNKMRELMLLGVFLNYFKKKEDKTNVFIIDKDYYSQIQEVSKLQKEKLLKIKEKSLEVVSNDFKNSTLISPKKKESTAINKSNETPSSLNTIDIKDKESQTSFKKSSIMLNHNGNISSYINANRKIRLYSNISVQKNKFTKIKPMAYNHLLVSTNTKRKDKEENEKLPVVKIPSTIETSKRQKIKNQKINYSNSQIKQNKYHSEIKSTYLPPSNSKTNLANINVIPLVLPTINLSNRFRQRKLCHF